MSVVVQTETQNLHVYFVVQLMLKNVYLRFSCLITSNYTQTYNKQRTDDMTQLHFVAELMVLTE